MKRRELLVGLAAAAIAEGCTSQPPSSVQQSQTQESQARYTNQIALPKPSVAGTVSLEAAIERRRSVRTFGPGPLPVGTIGQLLWPGRASPARMASAQLRRPARCTRWSCTR